MKVVAIKTFPINVATLTTDRANVNIMETTEEQAAGEELNTVELFMVYLATLLELCAAELYCRNYSFSEINYNKTN